MLEIVEKNTQKYQKLTKKSERKKKGQFFTLLDIAMYMAKLSKIRLRNIRLLDCGAGTGILGISLCKELIDDDFIKEIEIDFYENDKDVIKLLEENISELEKYSELKGKKLKCKIINENFILYNKSNWSNKEFKGIYDVIISNPPYKKLAKSSEESEVVNDIVFGQPNIYFIFMAMALHLLKPNGEMIFITPRSFTSGAYFKKFRGYLLDNSSIKKIHIFNSRNNLFKGEEVLQEAIITRFVKDNLKEEIEIVATNGSDFDRLISLKVPYSTILSDLCENKFILIPSSIDDIKILDLMKRWNNNLINLGYKLKTGPVVDFRAKELLSNYSEESVPLIWSDNFINNYIKKVNNKENYRYIKLTDKSKSILVENKDSIIIKRFTSKEESRRVQTAIYLKEEFIEYKYVGIENHLNYIAKIDGDYDEIELYGLFALFNSTIIDRYYRIINGNTQVNATEINSMPLPDINIIRNIGYRLKNLNDMSTEICDKIINDIVIGDEKI